MRAVRWTAAGALALAAVVGPVGLGAQAGGAGASSASAAAGARAGVAGAASASTRITRADAIASAIARGSRLAIARADTSLARAGLLAARQFENPSAGISYSKSVPQEHYSLDIPLDLPWLRSARVGSAESMRASAQHRFAYERRALEFEVDTAYTRALASTARARLSHRTAVDADSLLTLAQLRRDAGDGSELDVQLASVSAGQMANAAAADSLDALSALLALQVTMGLPGDAVTVAPSDSLTIADGAVGGSAASGSAEAVTPLLVAAAQADVLAADQALTLEKRRLVSGAALSVGWEARDPSGGETGTLPTVGLSLPLPLFNRNSAAIVGAQAQLDRARAQLAETRLEMGAAVTLARRAAASTADRAARSGRLVASADRVATLSLTAFREGAAALPNVLEAQRTAREALAQYINDVAAARNAAGLLQLLTLTTNGSNP